MLLRLGALATMALGLSPQPAPEPKYAAGQVWEYHARPRDSGSLLKIQEIETLGSARVYHISVSGVHFGASGQPQILPHSPVSEETLDASVVRLAPTASFPDTDFASGIAEWRQAKGGVFTITVSEIIDIIDHQIGELSN